MAKIRKTSGHIRKRYQITFKLLNPKVGKTGKPAELEVMEFSYEALGGNLGVAINRAHVRLRKEPSLFGISIRDAFISAKFLGDYSKAEEAQDRGIDPSELTTSSWRDHIGVEPAPVKNVKCPHCHEDIGKYPVKSLAYIKHIIGECQIGKDELPPDEEFSAGDVGGSEENEPS